MQPMRMSGFSPAISICSRASSPTTVWWRSTKSNTDPREYFVSLLVTTSSIASEMAMPSEPGCSGSSARSCLPKLVSGLGLGTTEAPYVSMRMRR